MADDPFDSLVGRIYSEYMERPWLSGPISRIVWGGDVAPFYASMDAVGEMPDGTTIVDCPCGAGPALRALRPGQGVRYLALDLSPAMLRRLRRRARARGLSQVEPLEADATELPLADGGADLFLSYWGLHCFEDPERAVHEAARVLRPGGRLVGSSFVTGDALRQRLLVRPGLGAFGDVPTAARLEGWLAAAGLAVTRFEARGPMLYFDATKAGNAQAAREAK